MAMPWSCYCHCMVIPRPSHGHVMVIAHGHVMVVAWSSHKHSVPLNGRVMVTPWSRHGHVM
eukprot:1555995-Lingulodinium_polyedra.AAC.1